MSFLSLMKARTVAGLLFLVVALSACTVVVEDDSRGPIGPGPGPLCSRQYDPVCARRGNDRQTFANACLADAAGYRVVRGGECGRADDGGSFCSREYDPVCARRGGDRRTFSNSCVADQAGYRVLSRGECRAISDTPRACTREYAPVCARRGSQVRTFPNGCEADAAGFRVLASGPC